LMETIFAAPSVYNACTGKYCTNEVYEQFCNDSKQMVLIAENCPESFSLADAAQSLLDGSTKDRIAAWWMLLHLERLKKGWQASTSPTLTSRTLIRSGQGRWSASGRPPMNKSENLAETHDKICFETDPFQNHSFSSCCNH